MGIFVFPRKLFRAFKKLKKFHTTLLKHIKHAIYICPVASISFREKNYTNKTLKKRKYLFSHALYFNSIFRMNYIQFWGVG